MNKLISYARYFLVLLLIIYVILAWMYFKDHAVQLTLFGLLLWFVIVPILLLALMLALRWRQKKVASSAADVSDISSEKKSPKPPDSYNLFIYSSICLPEGDNWSDVVDNDEDLTLLNEKLTDFDGLPILTKPIATLADVAPLPYEYMEATNLADSDLNGLTERLCSLIYEQLSLSDKTLSSIAQHFYEHSNQDVSEPNSAIDIHPDWQQHYLVSADKTNNAEPTVTPTDSSLSKLSIYLCVPEGADTDLLIAATKEQLSTYGLLESLITINPIVTNDIDLERNITYDSMQFINEHVMPLAQSASPELCLLIIADTQINDEWLELQLYSNNSSTIIPTEAGVLLIFGNQAAQDVLDIDTYANVLLTKICAPDVKDMSTQNADINDHSQSEVCLDSRRSYSHRLMRIKDLLLDNSFSLSSTTIKTHTQTELDDTINKTNVLPQNISVTSITDINPEKQPYDMSVYMSFIDALTAQDILVNELYLGHYMPSNLWLKPFIGLSLFVNLINTNQQESDYIFLETQHKRCSMLWLADFS
ncbi:hypothetical protein ACS8FB_03770 [Psychrobacter sp. 1U1]|uniref:hypothetical protein n=2 Tax=unclassified Psychrobacter TaxID=196806 RepID=UPI003F48D2C2